ncbi:hypothetical protein [Novosphingobium soli]|uniref:Uncharacterized protein n=1 Tax=Novosphingobium soli TaxID=574956 RepID=A0ABV6CXQ9_9SPHN
MERVAELRHKPAIVALLTKDIDFLPEDLRAFRTEGQRTMRHLASELGLTRSDYRLDYVTPRETIVGDHVLEADRVYMRLSVERFGSAALSFRPARAQRTGGRPRHASAQALSDIPALARQIAAHLQLAPVTPQSRLI